MRGITPLRRIRLRLRGERCCRLRPGALRRLHLRRLHLRPPAVPRSAAGHLPVRPPPSATLPAPTAPGPTPGPPAPRPHTPTLPTPRPCCDPSHCVPSLLRPLPLLRFPLRCHPVRPFPAPPGPCDPSHCDAAHGCDCPHWVPTHRAGPYCEGRPPGQDAPLRLLAVGASPVGTGHASVRRAPQSVRTSCKWRLWGSSRGPPCSEPRVLTTRPLRYLYFLVAHFVQPGALVRRFPSDVRRVAA